MIADSVSGPKVPAGDRPAEIRLAHPPLDERRNAVGLFQGHVEGRLADDGFAVGDQDGARREQFAVAIGNGNRPATVVEGRDGGKGGAEIDADEGHRFSVFGLRCSVRNHVKRTKPARANRWA